MDRKRIMLRSVLLWAALGFKLSWGKVLRGFELDWIGVKLAVPRGLPRTFEVELAEDKVEKLKEALQWAVRSTHDPSEGPPTNHRYPRLAF